MDPVNEAAVHEGIVFLDGGRIVEEGRHDELLRRGGRYADFWNASPAPATRE